MIEETNCWIIENNFCQILCGVLEFLSNGEGLGCFLWHNLPKLSEITVICLESIKGNKYGLSKMAPIDRVFPAWGRSPQLAENLPHLPALFIEDWDCQKIIEGRYQDFLVKMGTLYRRGLSIEEEVFKTAFH